MGFVSPVVQYVERYASSSESIESWLELSSNSISSARSSRAVEVVSSTTFDDSFACSSHAVDWAFLSKAEDLRRPALR